MKREFLGQGQRLALVWSRRGPRCDWCDDGWYSNSRSAVQDWSRVSTGSGDFNYHVNNWPSGDRRIQTNSGGRYIVDVSEFGSVFQLCRDHDYAGGPQRVAVILDGNAYSIFVRGFVEAHPLGHDRRRGRWLLSIFRRIGGRFVVGPS